MRLLYQFRDRWNAQSLAVQFLLAGGLVSLAAMAIVGFLVTSQIEDAVTRNSAATTALYVDSVIAPILPDMRKSEVLGDTISRALDETLSQGALGERLLSFKLWRHDGTILYAKDKGLVGRRFEPSDELEAAWKGQVVAEFNKLDDLESAGERARGKPLLEIYNPVLQPWSGEVVAVSEFYEIAGDIERSLNAARLKSWLAVASVVAAFFGLLSLIVFRGSRTIDAQKRSLNARVGELSELLAQNRRLRLRVQRASQRTAALNERLLRKIGADLHDGPAQLVALAALRLDSDVLTAATATEAARARELIAVKASLDDAMREIRGICSGLVLPHIEALDLVDVLRLAVAEHVQRSGSVVDLSLSAASGVLSPSAKICIYRFVQEALSNSFRHAGGAGQAVAQRMDGDSLEVEVTDKGGGFDPADVRPDGLGLAGLRERIESLGGRFDVESSASGTRVTMRLTSEELEPA